MRRISLSLFLVVIALVVDFNAQSPQDRDSPKGVIEGYLKMVEGGALLSSEGWNRVSILFSVQSPEPKDWAIFVTSKHAGVGVVWAKGNRAEVHDAWWDHLGSIDSSLLYTPPPAAKTNGNIGVYRLVRTDKHWEPGPDGQIKEVTGYSHWEIEGPLTWRWTTVHSAIRYVEQMRDRSSDPHVKQNADKTVEVLQRHLRNR